MFRPDPEVGIDKPDVCRAFVPLRLTFFFFSSSVILSSATLSVGAISSPDGEAIGGAGVGAGGGVDTLGLPVHILSPYCYLVGICKPAFDLFKVLVPTAGLDSLPVPLVLTLTFLPSLVLVSSLGADIIESLSPTLETAPIRSACPTPLPNPHITYLFPLVD
jgi:hypothetical protein